MAESIANGAREVDGVDVTVKRVPELVPEGHRTERRFQARPERAGGDPRRTGGIRCCHLRHTTRFGNMASQMRNFLDQTGGLWAGGKLIGKVGSVFTSTGTGGGSETTITSFWNTLAHHGHGHRRLCPMPARKLTDISEVRGGSPYGASTIAGADGHASLPTRNSSWPSIRVGMWPGLPNASLPETIRRCAQRARIAGTGQQGKDTYDHRHRFRRFSDTHAI